MANQSTFLAFWERQCIFLIAGLSLRNLLKIENSLLIEIVLFITSFIILFMGYLTISNIKSIWKNKKHMNTS
jgi:putative membrane protein